jgi:hypothetical protein
MAQPTEKNSVIEQSITQLFGINRRTSVLNNRCVMCSEAAVSFRNEISRREFSISGMCQHCQDSVFGVD